MTSLADALLLLPVQLTLLNGLTPDIGGSSPVTTIIPSPENPNYDNEYGSEGNNNQLGVLPMGAGRYEWPGMVYTYSLMVSAKVPNISGITYDWYRTVLERSWYIMLSTGTPQKWLVSLRDTTGIPGFPEPDLREWWWEFSNNTPSSAKSEIYAYDNPAMLYIPNSHDPTYKDNIMPPGSYIYEERDFTYSVNVYQNGVKASSVTLDTNQKIAVQYKNPVTGQSAVNDWIGVSNTYQTGTITPNISESKIRAIVGGTLPIIIQSGVNY